MGKRDRSSEDSTAGELVEEVQERGRNLLVRLLLGTIGLVLNTVRNLIGGLLHAVGALVGGIGGALAGVTGAVRTVLQGAGRVIRPGSSPSASESDDAPVIDTPTFKGRKARRDRSDAA